MKNSIIKGSTLILILFLGNVCWHVYRFAPDFPVGDQWGLWAPLLNQSPVFEGFFYQHGSHFLGLGHLISAFSGHLSGYYLPTEGYITAFLMAFNAILALLLKRKIVGRLSYLDLFIPILFLNPMLTEVFLWKAHSSVVALPLMFTLLLGHLILQKDSPGKLLLMAALFFFSAFTGYAFLVSVLCLTYTVYLIWNSKYNTWIFASLFLQFATIALFVIKYSLPKESMCGLTSDHQPYIRYMITMFFHFFGGVAIKPGTSIALIAGILAPLLYAAIAGKFKVHRSTILANSALALFSLGYVLLNTYSRACLGVDTARAPRYTAFLMPLFLSGYHFVVLSTRHKSGLYRYIPVVLVLTFLTFRLKPNAGYQRHVATVGNQYEKWRECYEETHNAIQCSESIGKYPLYSLNNEQAKERWAKFKKLQRP